MARSYDKYKASQKHKSTRTDKEAEVYVPCVLQVPQQDRKSNTNLFCPGLFSKRFNGTSMPSYPYLNDNLTGTNLSYGQISNQKSLTALPTILQHTDTVPLFREKPVYAKPNWPFTSWSASNFLKKETLEDYFIFPNFTSEVKLSCLRSVFDIELSSDEMNNTPYMSFINDLFNEITMTCSEEVEHIKSMVERIMEDTLCMLAERYKMFKNCKLLKMGSTYEGTKIGNPDEFDFMIELPELQDGRYLEFTDDNFGNHLLIKKSDFSYRDSEKRTVKVLDRAFFNDINTSEDEADDKSFIRSLWNSIHSEIAELMKSALPNGWKWLDMTPGVNTLALTQTLLWKGEEFPKLVINIDICLSVPDVSFDGDCGSGRHVILRSTGENRYTFAVKEMGVWNNFAPDNGRKMAYRVIKRLISNYIPKSYNDDLFRLDTGIPSYWLKTILFYMFEYYSDEKSWTIEEVPLRILEALLLLEKCLASKECSSYFVPHNVLKKFAWQDKIKDFDHLLQDVTTLNTYLLDLCDKDSDSWQRFVELGAEIQSHNEQALEKGLLESLILICYLYAYNEYQESTLASTYEFVSLFLDGIVKLRGTGKDLKLFYKDVEMSIGQRIKERYDDESEYFNTKETKGTKKIT